MKLALAVVVSFVGLAGSALGQEKERAARGALAVRGQPNMNPPLWSPRGYADLWKQWGLKEKPADFDERLRERYGLHAAPHENGGLPMGLHYSQGLLGKGVINDCLLCHAGVVAGQTIIGAPNSSLDLQSLFDDLAAADRSPFKVPVQVGYARGTVDPVNPVAFLMEFRNPDLSLRDEPLKLEFTKDIASDPPAWWLLQRKKTRNWTGGVDVNSVRVDMVNLLTPLNSPEHIKRHEGTFADIHAFIMTVQAPKYPFPVDRALAEQGRGLFNETCARCHGTYGPDGKYPDKVVPLDTIGTDRTLALAVSGTKNIDYFNKSWFAQEKGPDGRWYKVDETAGYQAPPLDGVWATAPYLHNSSVPTIAHLLDSKSRPRFWTRSYRSDKEDYDAERVGWKISTVDRPPAPELSGHERRKIYDTTQPGRSNAGHTFGDEFSDAQRRAVIEYLKTL